MGYGLKLSSSIGTTKNHLEYNGRAIKTALNNLQPRKAVALPQWLKPKETK